MSNNENGYVKRWQLGVSLIGVCLAFGALIFRAGMVDAAMELKVAAIERHVDYDDAIFERKDVIEQRLLYIEEQARKVEGMQRDQNEQIRQFLMERRGR